MPGEFDPSHEVADEMPDYGARLDALAVELELPEHALSERGRSVAVTLLEEHWREHGDKSKETYKPYHGGEHPLDIIGRSWRLIKILAEILPNRFDSLMYELGAIAGAGHDVINKPGAPVGQNERRSAKRTGTLMREAGYGEPEIERVEDAIITTTVTRNAEGVIIQTNMRVGSRDALKPIVAEADINGIIMEGVPTMVRDVFNLFLEFSGGSLEEVFHNPTGAADFFRTQAQFLEDRLAVIDQDLGYYFSEKEKDLIQAAYAQEFNGRTRDALAAARVLFRFSKLPEEIIRTALTRTEDMASAGTDRFMQLKHYLVEVLTRSHDG
ncbi:MAG TPA: hypothetical protein VK712_03795 [Verrucomicrobiae bacterium]|jgi:hypothetical protein|nr:hypothetical protein [Verrucomicrobiae bacterium]